MTNTPLLERDSLLRRLDSRLRDASNGRGSLVLIAGEAGAGKTSLLAAAAQGTDAVILQGACDPLTTPRPLSPLHDIARDPNSQLESAIDATDSTREMFTSVLNRLTGSHPPVFLIIEDIHWADEATLDLILFLGRRVGDSNAVIACSYRDDEVSGDHPARLVIGDLVTRSTTELILVPPLSVEAVAELSGLEGEAAKHLHEVTSGNAFYVTEIVNDGDRLPRSVQEAVLARVGRLSPESRLLVETVATAPRGLDLVTALEVSGTDSEAADRAVEQGVLVGDGGRLLFRHELARETVEKAVPPGRLIGLHQHMIDVLQHNQSNDLARLAHHAIQAADAGLVARFAPAAAEQASRQGAHREAARFLSLAIDSCGSVDPETEATWRDSLATELGILDRHSEALDQRQLTVSLRRDLGDAEKLAMSLCGLSESRWATGDAPGSKEASERALQVLAGRPASYPHAYALYSLARNAMLRRQHQAAMDSGAKAIAMAGEIGADDLVTTTMIITAAAELVMGDSDLAVSRLREAIARDGLPEDSRNAALGWWMLGSGGGEARMYPVAIEALEKEIEVGLQTDDDYGVAYARAWMARIAFDQGRWDDTERFAAMVPPSRDRGVIAPITALGALGRARVRRGEKQGKENLELALNIGKQVSLQYIWSPTCGLAELAWLENRHDDIPGILRSVFDEASGADSPWAKGEISTWLWRSGTLDSPLPGSARPFATLIEGEWEESARLWGEIGCPYEQALALAEGSTDAMLDGLTALDRLGARPAAIWLRSRLRQSGVESIPRGPQAETLLNPVGLTRRQVEVLALMSAGLSNGEIADRLYISKKTTEHHVSAVLSKLGASTRAQAMAKADVLGLSGK